MSDVDKRFNKTVKRLLARAYNLKSSNSTELESLKNEIIMILTNYGRNSRPNGREYHFQEISKSLTKLELLESGSSFKITKQNIIELLNLARKEANIIHNPFLRIKGTKNLYLKKIVKRYKDEIKKDPPKTKRAIQKAFQTAASDFFNSLPQQKIDIEDLFKNGEYTTAKDVLNSIKDSILKLGNYQTGKSVGTRETLEGTEYDYYIEPFDDSNQTKLKIFEDKPELNEFARLEEKISWILKDRVTLADFAIQSEGFDFSFRFKRLNIFIGKNNSGKTRALREIRRKLDNNSFTSYTTDPIGKDILKYTRSFYIPNTRVIGERIGTIKPRREAEATFQNALIEISDLKILDNEVPWKIPDLASVLEFLIFEEDPTDPIPDHLKETYKECRKVYSSWKKNIEDNFWGIKIEESRQTRAAKIEFIALDSDLNLKLGSWRGFGSGTQHLLSLILIIEILKSYHKLIFPEIPPTSPLAPLNGILFIDEPELSLHPSLQRLFFDYLADASKTIQIFLATHSLYHSHPGKDVALFLFQKAINPKETIMEITENNYLLVLDEMVEPDALKGAKMIAEDHFAAAKYPIFSNLPLQMVNLIETLFKQDLNDPNHNFYKNILNLGTTRENSDIRLLQNVHFLRSPPVFVELRDNQKILSLKQIFIIQLHLPEGNKQHQIQDLFAIWDSKFGPGKIPTTLTYSEEKARLVKNKIHNFFEGLKPIINKGQSLILLPENTIPYSLIPELISFAKENKIVIVGGMEHQTYSWILDFIKELPPDAQGLLYDKKKPYRKHYPLEDSDIINFAIIINCNGRFTFQIKHYPVYLSPRFGEPELTEHIPLLKRMMFDVYNTSVGPLGILICKDFLANYEVLPVWMEKYSVPLVLVPSLLCPSAPF